MSPRKTRGKNPDRTDILTSLVETAVDKIDALSLRMEGVDKKLDLHIQKTQFELSAIKTLDTEQNKILEEHHQRSSELKRDNDLKEKELRTLIEEKDSKRADDIASLSKRVARVEVPQKFLFWAKKVFVWIAAASGAGAAVLAFIKWLRGI